MRLRLFRASSMAEAMAMVRAELGEEAVILGSRRVAGETEVTAALEPADPILIPPVPSAAIRPAAAVAAERAGRLALLQRHNMPPSMAEELADRVGIMVRGRLQFLGTVADLRARGSGPVEGAGGSESRSLEQLYLEITSTDGPGSSP